MKIRIISENLIEDLLDANNKKFMQSIKKAREEYEKGEMFTHEQVFAGLNDKTS